MFCVFQAAHYIGRGCNVVLCIQNVTYGTPVDAEMVVSALHRFLIIIIIVITILSFFNPRDLYFLGHKKSNSDSGYLLEFIIINFSDNNKYKKKKKKTRKNTVMFMKLLIIRIIIMKQFE